MDGIEAPAIPNQTTAAPPLPAQGEEGAAAKWKQQLAQERARIKSATEKQLGKTEARSQAGRGPRINPVGAVLMILTALLFDGGQAVIGIVAGLTAVLLPLAIAVSWVIDIIAWLTFFLWFKAKGVGFGFSRRWGRMAGAGESESLLRNPLFIIAVAFGFEFIPLLNALPAWTLAIVVTIVIEYAAYATYRTGIGMLGSLMYRRGAWLRIPKPE